MGGWGLGVGVGTKQHSIVIIVFIALWLKLGTDHTSKRCLNRNTY